MNTTIKLPQAVCLLLNTQPTMHVSTAKWVAVSRRNSTTQFGFPGGKVDPGETPIEALVREVREETNIKINPDLLQHVYTGIEGGYEVLTYLYNESLTHYLKVTFDQLILAEPEEGIDVKWMLASELSDPTISPFAKYNAQVFNSIKE